MSTPAIDRAPTVDHVVDVLVIGAGVAGLVAALDVIEQAPGLRVAVLDKGVPGGQGGSTPLAQGGLAAAMGPDDSPALHAADTMRAGDGLCGRRAVEVVATEGPGRVADLIRRGAVFDRADGALALAREGGQRVARSVRAADSTGAEVARALRRAAAGRITRLQGLASALGTAGADGRVVGAWALLDATEASDLGPAQAGGTAFVAAGTTLLATGGCGGLYASTTNPDGATADGVALAYAAGARLTDMEFVQFHPTGLKPRGQDGYQRFLLTEALRGAGARLVNARGERFMVDRHPDAELAPRYVVTKAILDQPDGVWLDATAIGEAQLDEEFPMVRRGVAQAGFDLHTDPVPVEPCEHYMIGGVATDLDGRTSVPGLWAAGEVACPGVHGANRMAGNSLVQASVFAHRAARDMVEALQGGGPPHGPPDDGPPATHRAASTSDLETLRHELRTAMSAGAGAVRTGGGLTETVRRLTQLRDVIGPGPFADRTMTEAHNALVAAALITDSALLRTESRGTHWRDDHPSHGPSWEGRHIDIVRPSAITAPAADHRTA